MERIDPVPILQVVGFKNSGKTSVIEKVLHVLNRKGYKAGVIKHHGHGGKPDSIDLNGTDTDRFQQSGANVTAVEGNGMIQMQINTSQENSLSLLTGLYKQLPIDFILIEGYKVAPYPKVIIYKTAEEKNQLLRLRNIVAMIGPSAEDLGNNLKPAFSMDKPEHYIPFFEEFIKRS
ncbi:molybdopterin-guanine dinucleotide biosynthesis protein B [Alkalihalobacillus sp. AL-G]|uniref:molybdopterin-guanine dinucleotide biosynthesis protein B n=1 Tax=Alkalihalobacillus sp. AL-G TaxID=2926399 RepID=UPI00272A60FC|nr:molybdopterin-guanine dinucleotide biosynthesis protein B [Alkalihalobacillus sp. AL-G]WLD94891.1 molybdopterin-guanine dinucleotide biosynthesis protein B [Alkalihalobacillus sp. AL-G]